MAPPNSAEKLWKFYKVKLTAGENSQRLRNDAAVHHRNLVRKVAHRMTDQCAEPYLDLEQIGFIGLLKAVDRFNPTKGIAFSSFAVPYIRGEILHFLRDHGSGVKIPRRWREFHASCNSTEQLWAARHGGKAPTEQQLAAAVGCQVGKLRQVRGAIANQRPSNLDDELQTSLEVAVAEPEFSNRLEIAWGQLRQKLQDLSSQEQQLLAELYCQKHTRKEVAQAMHLEANHFRSLLEHALNQIA